MNAESPHFLAAKGQPFPFGVSLQNGGINFALVSTSATSITLMLFDRETREKIAEFHLSPEANKTGDVWHICIQGELGNCAYAYQIEPFFADSPQLLLDPYAKGVNTLPGWGRNNPYNPFGEIIPTHTFDWENDAAPRIPLNETIIYEMHVRAFTQHRSSNTQHPGTFLGVIEKIPHLKELGINAVELLPIHEFNELEYLHSHPKSKKTLYNFWGYSTVNFFAPMKRYATENHAESALNEFKMMVKELHKNGIEVILDVVFNHTAEQDAKGPVISYKGIDNAVYYILDKEGAYLNFSGCGNTFNANHPIVQELIINSLRYWVTEMHVDGFRFDLASTLTRDVDGEPLSAPPVIKAITEDPMLSSIKLIAEPWDASGLYQVGNFAPESKRWSEWNGKYRDTIRRFIKGTPWTHGEFAMRLCGSEDLYRNRTPNNSINFVTCHDGFTLMDLVSYNDKHNLSNGEENRDGANDNYSWNCGIEGPATNKKILYLRERQRRNFHLALMLSQGVPMLFMGDEYGHTKLGNNNTWCHDSELNWFLWDRLEKDQGFYRFYRLLIHFRKQHPVLSQKTFLTNNDIDWHGLEPLKPDWNSSIPFVAYTLKDHTNGHDLYVAFNAQDHAVTMTLPHPPYAKKWHWVVNTGNTSPEDIFEENKGPLQQEGLYKLSSFSAILLQAS